MFGFFCHIKNKHKILNDNLLIKKKQYTQKNRLLFIYMASRFLTTRFVYYYKIVYYVSIKLQPVLVKSTMYGIN
jgi:hypothetical protein